MARTKITRRTYKNKKMQAIGNLKEAESAHIEAPAQHTSRSQSQATSPPIPEKESGVLPDQTEPTISKEIAPQNSPILGSVVGRRDNIDGSEQRRLSPNLQKKSLVQDEKSGSPVLGCSQRNPGCSSSTPITHSSTNTTSTSRLTPSSPTFTESDLEWDSPEKGMEQNSQLQANFRPITPDISNITNSPILGGVAGLQPSCSDNIDGSEQNTVSSTQEDSSRKENRQLQANFRPITPDISNIPVDEFFSPKTQNELRSTIRALFPNGPPPPPPVKPMRRPKKGDMPYIVGCTTRRRVPSPKGLSVFKGDSYGITDKTNCDEDEQDDTPAKRARRAAKGTASISKSRFNPLSDEIAERLKMYEKIDRLLGRAPKEETVGFMSKPSTSRKFSPIPSTSTDSETIMKNDKHFNESLNCDNYNFDIDDDDELPEIMWDTNKRKRDRYERNESPLALIKKDKKTDIMDTYAKSDYGMSPSSTQNNNDDSPILLNEDMNNNNNDVMDIDNNFCEIDFDKYLPKEKLIIIDDDEITSSKPKTKPEVVDTIQLNDGYKSIAPRVIDNTSSSDVICIEDDVNVSKIDANGNVISTATTQGSANQVMSSVLRARNKMPNATETSPNLVIDVSDVIVPAVYSSSRASVSRLPIWNEDVQFVSETRAREPRLNSANRENISDVQIVGTSQSVNAAQRRNDELLNELQQFFAMLSESSSMGRPRKAKRKSKKQKPCHTVVVNNENTAPTVNQAPTPTTVPIQPPAPSGPESPTNGKKLGDCPICLDSLRRGFIASTNCGHVFCLDCIKRSLTTTGRTCPTCRKQLKGTGYHQVFL